MPRIGGPNRGSVEKPNNFGKTLKKLFNDLNKYHISILIALIFAIISSVIAIICPNILSDLVDVITNGLKKSIDMNLVRKMSLTLLILFSCSSIIGYFQNFVLATVSNKYALNLRKRIVSKLNKLPLKFFDNHETGDILSRISNDVDNISQNLNHSLGTLVSGMTLLIGSTIMMFTTNVVMSISAIIASLFGFALMFLILSKSQKYFDMKQAGLGNLNSHIEEIYSGHDIVKVYNGEKNAKKEFDKLNKDLYYNNQKSQFLSGLMPPMMGFIGNFGYVVVCIVGAYLTIKGKISFGVIVAFMIYIRLFTNPLSQIAQAMSSLQSTAASAERVFEFLSEKEMNDESNLDLIKDIKNIKGNIEFKNVRFSYNDDKVIIKNFSANIKDGQKIAIVGPTGAGKTTLVNLLMKFYDINEGDIIIDGISIKNISREQIHELFTMVLQDTWLFNGTIKENIVFNNKNITENKIWDVLSIVGIKHFVKTLSGGLNAIVDNGESVSQGEKQLLTIARGMLEDTPFLILDEATSNVDTRTEELVQKAMDKLTKGKTSFIIAHRLSTIKNADLILVMNEGNIVEQGTHSSLMKKKGAYYELYNSQFSKNI